MKKLVLLLLLLSLVACAENGMLIPKPDGLYSATGKNPNPEKALKIALRTAEQCCKEQNRKHIVLNISKTAEEGLIAEKPAKVLDVAKDVAFVTVGIFSPLDGDDLRGQKTAEITFRCE